MKIRDFLLDRSLYLLFYGLSVAILLMVVQLALFPQHARLAQSDILYIIILSFIGILLFLLLDYARQRLYYRQLLGLKGGLQKLEDPLLLNAATTREQRAVCRIIQEHYVLYVKELAQYRKMQEQHHHFVNQWVHQMKTPVSIISLLTQQPTNETLQSIEEENERLLQGLDMMLHTARLEQFEWDVAVKQVDLVHILRKVINENKKACIRYAIFPKLVCEVEEAYVETDEKWVVYVFNQLVRNAIKYSIGVSGSDRGLQITVTNGQGAWSVSVMDHGIGIPAHDLPRIFDPFFTGENGRKTMESTGMGLFLAKQVCTRLGHSITAESTEGSGTAITVHFPLPQTLHHW